MSNNNAYISVFKLPREDWYDSSGRIYKDALIENFNAIENKLNELSKLDAFDITLPDFSTISYPDVTYDSDDDAIVNLKSLLTLIDLFYYPIELEFSGTTCKKCCYWGEDYKYVTLTNVETDADDTNKYIILNTDTQTITAESSLEATTTQILLGVYTNGSVVGLFSPNEINLNPFYMLADMSLKTRSDSKGSNQGYSDYDIDGKRAGSMQTQRKTGITISGTFHVYGTKA